VSGVTIVDLAQRPTAQTKGLHGASIVISQEQTPSTQPPRRSQQWLRDTHGPSRAHAAHPSHRIATQRSDSVMTLSANAIY
jgi:hypothetical protein